MFVKLDNGKWVDDPTFFGREWYLRIQDEEAYLTVHTYRDPSEEGLKKRMRKILRDANVAATLADEDSLRGESPFPPNWKGLKNCATIKLDLAPVPMPSDLDCRASRYTTIQPEEVLNES
jgi:hypothetical protein